jgi:hypothetical protein
MQQIALACQEQETGVGDANRAIASMETGAWQNAALVKESASATGSLYREAENLSGQVGLFRLALVLLAGLAGPAYAGAQAARHVLRVAPEFSYSLSPTPELGAYLLTSVDGARTAGVDGEKLRLKFLAGRASGQAYFLGLNLAVDRVARRIGENPWDAELKGLVGTRVGAWTIACNPDPAWQGAGPVAGPHGRGEGQGGSSARPA